RNNMRINTLILSLLILLSSCLSVKNIVHLDSSIKNLLKTIPKIDMIKDSNNLIFNFTFNVQPDKEKYIDFLKGIKKIRIELLDTNENILKFAEIMTDKSGTDESEEIEQIGLPYQGLNVIFFSKIFMEDQNRDDYRNISCKYTIEYKDWKYSIVEQCEKILYSIDKPAIDTYPVIVQKNDEFIELGIFAVRKRSIEEYIPNSEIIRIEVLNNRGKPVFNSEEGGNFMQVINPVYPEIPGDSYLYTFQWNYKNNKGSMIIPGKYKINMIIPALPKPYFSEMKFTWEAK
ncbi:hypothetical protein ACFLSQ_07190, partial [Bacteroidota bacterium]